MRTFDLVFTIFCFAYCPWCAECSLYNCGLGFESNDNAFYASDPHCVPCAEGKFKNTYGPGRCVACPNNFSTSTRGSYYCDACEVGFKMVFESTLKCQQCNPCYTTYTKTDEFCRPCRVKDIGVVSTCQTLELHGQGCWSYLTKDEIHKQYLKEFENWPQTYDDSPDGDNSPMEFDTSANPTNIITDEDLKKYMLNRNDPTVPMVLRLQDPDFFRRKRQQWWNEIKESNTYNGYTYTVGPLLPFGPSLKQVFNTTLDTLDSTLREEFMNRDDIDKKFVDIEFLQFYSTNNLNDAQISVHYSNLYNAVSRYHPMAAFPVKIHEVGTNLSKNFDFSGEVYKAILKILKLFKPENVCLVADEPYDVECQAQRYGITWENVDTTLEHYELEKKIKDNAPKNHGDYCDFTGDVVNSYWYWFCTFGSTFYTTEEGNSRTRERSIRPFYQATNYTLYNATKFYEAASGDIRRWEQKNIDFYECTDPGDHAQDFSGNSVTLTLDFVPEARGQIREISIYTMSDDNKKQFLYCNRSISDVAMTIQIFHTSTFFIRVQFFENQFLYNVTMNQADLRGAWTVNHGTINNRSDSLSYEVSHTSDSVAIDWTMQESQCEAGSSSQILTVSDFHFLYRTMEPKLCRV